MDVWGRIRRTVEADAASAQVSAADLANAKLLAQAQLVTAYFNLRASDELEAVIEDTLKGFRRTRDILKNQYDVGISSRADFITADNLVLSTEAQAIDVGVARAQYEHAIAVLTGRPPYELSIPRRRWATQTPPRFPVTVPSRLLERRPDIAAAERQLQQLNALVGVAVANFYPNISLTGALTFIGPQPWPVIAANEAWSMIGGATQTMYEGGLLDAQLQVAKANYEQGVATYRQTVLTAFQQVEDQLAAIRILAREAERYREAVKEARDAVGFYSQSISGRHGRFHLGRDGAGDVSLERGIRADRAAKSLCRERQPDSIARRRLGRRQPSSRSTISPPSKRRLYRCRSAPCPPPSRLPPRSRANRGMAGEPSDR